MPVKGIILGKEGVGRPLKNTVGRLFLFVSRLLRSGRCHVELRPSPVPSTPEILSIGWMNERNCK